MCKIYLIKCLKGWKVQNSRERVFVAETEWVGGRHLQTNLPHRLQKDSVKVQKMQNLCWENLTWKQEWKIEVWHLWDGNPKIENSSLDDDDEPVSHLEETYVP